MLFLSAALAATGYAARVELVTLDLERPKRSFALQFTENTDTTVRAVLRASGAEFNPDGWSGVLWYGTPADGGITITNIAAAYGCMDWRVPAVAVPTNGRYTVQIFGAKGDNIEEWGSGILAVRLNPARETLPAEWQSGNLAYITATNALAVATIAHATADAAAVTANRRITKLWAESGWGYANAHGEYRQIDITILEPRAFTNSLGETLELQPPQLGAGERYTGSLTHNGQTVAATLYMSGIYNASPDGSSFIPLDWALVYAGEEQMIPYDENDCSVLAFQSGITLYEIPAVTSTNWVKIFEWAKTDELAAAVAARPTHEQTTNIVVELLPDTPPPPDRIITPDGFMWIDATGCVWRVDHTVDMSHVVFRTSPGAYTVKRGVTNRPPETQIISFPNGGVYVGAFHYVVDPDWLVSCTSGGGLGWWAEWTGELPIELPPHSSGGIVFGSCTVDWVQEYTTNYIGRVALQEQTVATTNGVAHNLSLTGTATLNGAPISTSPTLVRDGVVYRQIWDTNLLTTAWEPIQ